MTKFEDKSFSTPANSKKFTDNWDKVFGKEDKAKKKKSPVKAVKPPRVKTKKSP